MRHPSPTGPSPDVLNGWKEIAGFFGKGVRTVQRWEKEMGLPVRRLGPKGEVVYALPAELEDWRRRQEQSREAPAGAGTGLPNATDADDPAETPDTGGTPRLEPPPGRPGRLSRSQRRGAIVAAFLLVASVASFLALERITRDTTIAKLRISQDQLLALDARGNTLWTATLPYRPVRQGDCEDSRQWFARIEHHTVLIADIDSDKAAEVLLVLNDEPGEQGEIVCYRSDGTLAWRRRPDRTARFGHGQMGPPWLPLYFVLVLNEAGRHDLWASWANRPDFAGFVERLDGRTGQPTAVYWSAGYVTALSEGVVQGKRVVLIGAANNEHRGATLAVYDARSTAGSPPAVNPVYACFDCPTIRPLAFFVFPKTHISREMTAETATLPVTSIIQGRSGEVIVTLEHGGPAAPDGAGVFYRFEDNLRVLRAEVLDNYRTEHRRLERAGRLKGPFDENEARELFPVIRWQDGTWDTIVGTTR